VRLVGFGRTSEDDTTPMRRRQALLSEAPPITPARINRITLRAEHVGAPVRLVGLGTTGPGDMTPLMRREVQTTLTVLATNTFFTGNGAGTICYGDSGGPQFMLLGGLEVVAGVTSATADDCVSTALAANVDLYDSPFIQPFLDEHDPAPMIDAGPPPGSPDAGSGTDGDGGGCAVGGRGHVGAAALALLALPLALRRRRVAH
jgi:hypothetical protein